MDKFYGSWTQESCENVDAFLGALKIGFILRTAAKTQTPTIKFSHQGDVIAFKTITTFKTDVVEFELGKEFAEKRLDGIEVQTTAVIQDGALVFHKEGDKPYTVAFSIEGEKLKATYTIGNVVATRTLAKDANQDEN